MGGRIWVESSGIAGEGSCFSFTLPAAPMHIGLPFAALLDPQWFWVSLSQGQHPGEFPGEERFEKHFCFAFYLNIGEGVAQFIQAAVAKEQLEED